MRLFRAIGLFPCAYIVCIMLYCVHIYQMYFFLSVWPFLYIFLFSVVINQKSHKCIRSVIAVIWLLLHLRPNYIHSASNDIHTDGPRATARARG